MKKHVLILIALMLITAAFNGCSSAKAAKVYGENDKYIAAKAGETFTIKLDENPTTGYEWADAVISDESVVKQVSSEYKPTPANSNIVGSGGQRIITFKALKVGTATITLNYQRSWETESPAETLTFNVTVK